MSISRLVYCSDIDNLYKLLKESIISRNNLALIYAKEILSLSDQYYKLWTFIKNICFLHFGIEHPWIFTYIFEKDVEMQKISHKIKKTYLIFNVLYFLIRQ